MKSKVDRRGLRGRRREASRPMGRAVGEEMSAAVWSMDARLVCVGGEGSRGWGKALLKRGVLELDRDTG